METPRPTEAEIELSMPQELPIRARNNIRWAITSGRINKPEDLGQMTDDQIKRDIRSSGRTQGIGSKTLLEVRKYYPLAEIRTEGF